MDAAELAVRAVRGYAETLACLGRSGVRGATEVRRDGAVGARVPWAADNHWIDAAVVGVGAAPPRDADGLPHCLWTVADAGPGWSELPEATMPCMGLELTAEPDGHGAVQRPSLAALGTVNDEAYGQKDRLAPLLAGLDPAEVETHGLRVDGVWACVAMTLTQGDDVSIQYVATDARFRRRGLAGALLRDLLAGAWAAGRTTATLQASPDGLPVYERLGFRTVATLRGVARTGSSPPSRTPDA